jgi:hypothetical protein
MKTVTIVAVLLALMAAPVVWVAREEPQRTFRSPVAMELFQSQGCSDCPPAREYLNRLSERSDVLALSYGVTYWDYLGWKDSFASPQFTRRKRGYSIRNHGVGVATPQYWINGQVTVLSANPVRVANLVDLGGPVDGPSVSIAGSTLNIGSGSALPGGANIWLVYFDPGTIPVAIRASENGGCTVPHRDIVRELKLLGRWSGDRQTIYLTVSPDGSEKRGPGASSVRWSDSCRGGDIGESARNGWIGWRRSP